MICAVDGCGRFHPGGFACALLIIGGLGSACSEQPPEEVASETVVPVTTEAARLGTIRGVVHATGTVTPAPGADQLIVAPQAARIAEIPKAEGDRVRRGDLLVRFEIPTLAADAAKQRAEVRRADARIANARAAQARAHDLFDRGVAARREVEDADRELANAEADKAGAEAELNAADAIAGRMIVRAAFSGIVARRAHNPGDLVEPTASDAVLRVVDPSRLEISASVPITDVARVTIGAAARLSGDAPGPALAVVSRPAAVEPGTAAVPIRLAFKGMTTLPVGTPVEVEIDAEEHAGIVVVPAAAVVREGNETAVFVAVGNKAQRRTVTIGVADDTRIEVRSGVKVGEAIITDGQGGLPDGAAIATDPKTKPEPDSRLAAKDPMNIAAAAIRHYRAAVIVVAALVVAGAFAAQSLPSSIYPPLQFPRIAIIAHSGTLPSQSMSLTVTRPIEQAVMEVPGIRRVRSRSIRGAAEISAQFDPATDMVVALQQVQNHLSEIQDDLPTGSALTVERLTPAVFPVFILTMTGTLPTPEVSDYALYVVKPEIARVPGTGRIEVLSSDTREIEVVLDPLKLTSAGLTVSDVSQALRSQNTLQPVGRFSQSGLQYLTLATGLWQSADAIGKSPVLIRNGSTIRVADVGSVMPGSPDRTVLVTGNGRDAVSIGISQQIGANILAVKRGVDAAIATLAHTLPSGIRITKVYDLAEFVEASIANVRDAILIGGFLAIIVLIVFLRDLRLTLIAAFTLPLAIIPTFLFMRVFGGSINLMSMGGLAVAIGLVIDDAVVVVENINRRAGEGVDRVVDAVSQLMAPLVSSTLTTVVVFAPLGLLSGITGQFFRALSLSLTVAVLMSLFLSISIVPLLARWALRHRHAFVAVPEIESRWQREYGGALRAIVGRPTAAVIMGVLLAGAAVVLFSAIGTGFLPPADEGGFVVDYLTPAGSALDETDRQVKAMEKVIAAIPEVAAYSRRTGSELGLFATASNSGDILVRLKPRGDRRRSAEEVIADLRPQLQRAAPLADIEFVQLLQDMLGDLEGAPTPIEIKIFGDDSAKLEALAAPVKAMLQKIDGVVDVVGMQRGNPEFTWIVDPVASGRFGLTVEQVGAQMSASWLGDVATELRLLDRRIPVRVRLPDSVRFAPGRFQQALLKTSDGKLVPVASVARAERTNGQSELLRENLRGMALVTARLEGRDLGSAVDEIRTRLPALRLPIGYTYEIGGQYESQRQAFRELFTVFGVAIVLVFTILVVQFQAWVPALLILVAAPLSLGGAFALLLLTGTDLNVSSAMGLILLVGLVVKNGIMLLDFSEQLHGQGESFERAIAHAGRIRLRPILMTTFCTLFGLLPLAFGLGAGAEQQKPLALAVIGGLALSTPVTLLVVPGLYAAIRRRTDPRAT